MCVLVEGGGMISDSVGRKKELCVGTERIGRGQGVPKRGVIW